MLKSLPKNCLYILVLVVIHRFPPQFRNFKIIYRRYAGLYFCICVDVTDNNLAYLEAIHNFVEVNLTHANFNVY